MYTYYIHLLKERVQVGFFVVVVVESILIAVSSSRFRAYSLCLVPSLAQTPTNTYAQKYATKTSN